VGRYSLVVISLGLAVFTISDLTFKLLLPGDRGGGVGVVKGGSEEHLPMSGLGCGVIESDEAELLRNGSGGGVM
jgi:hypothetical protein